MGYRGIDYLIQIILGAPIFKHGYMWNMNVYTLDAIVAMSIMFSTAVLVLALAPIYSYSYYVPEKELSLLLSEPGFIKALYCMDVKTVEAYLNSYLDEPYNLTVYDEDGVKLFSVGCPVEGISAVAVLPGWNGTLRKLIVSLRVGG